MKRKTHGTVISDEEWAKIPAIQEMNRHLKLLEALRELHSGAPVDWIALQKIAAKFEEKATSRKVSELLKMLGFDVSIQRADGLYYVPVSRECLDYLLKKYSKWKV